MTIFKEKLQKFAFKLQTVVTKLINFLFANLFYFLGVGLTSLLAKLFGKQFLDKKKQGSSWQAAKNKLNLDRQF